MKMKERKKRRKEGKSSVASKEGKINYKGVHGMGASKPSGKKLLAGTDEFMYESKPWVALHTIYLLRASQSVSSLAGSHLSPLGPSPCQRTQYSFFFSLCSLVNDPINVEFLVAIDSDWFRRYKGSGWEQVVIVFFERVKFRGMEDREEVG